MFLLATSAGVGSLAGIPHLFYLLILDKSSSALLFLTGRLVGASVCFLHIVNFGNGCASSSRRRRRAFSFRVLVIESADDAVMVCSSSF